MPGRRLVTIATSWAIAALLFTSVLYGQGTGSDSVPVGMDLMTDLVYPLMLAVIFTAVGMVLFAISIWIIVKLAPFSVQKEIEEDQNTALGIIIGSMILGIAIILAAAMIG